MKRPRVWSLYGTHTPGSLLNARADPVQIRQVVEATTISVGARLHHSSPCSWVSSAGCMARVQRA